MSHTIAISDDLYERIASLAAREGQEVDRVVEELLAHGIRSSSDSALNWETASAEEIIADLRASRVERERPIEL